MLNVFDRDGALRHDLLSQQLQYQRCRDVQHPDRRTRDALKQRHRIRDEPRNRLSVLEGDPLGNQFPHDELQKCDAADDDGERETDSPLVDPCDGKLTKPRCQGIGEFCPGIRRREGRDERDANLHGRQKPIGIMGELQRDGRRPVTFLGPFFQPSAPRGQNRNLSRRKETVEQRHEHNHAQFHHPT